MNQTATINAAAAAKEDPFEPINWCLYAAIIRQKRKIVGWKRAQDLSNAIYKHTKLHVSRDIIYKIEQAKQIPSLEQFLAINIALYGEPWPSIFTEYCINPEWRELLEPMFQQNEA